MWRAATASGRRPQFAIVRLSFQDIAQKNTSMTIAVMLNRNNMRRRQAPALSLYNPGMRQITILLPFSFPSPELAVDLLRALRLPSFALLTGRGKASALQVNEDFARSLPHEAWLARRFGLQAGLEQGGSPPVAPAAMAAFGLESGTGRWFMLQPAHLHVARDHLVLTDRRRLALAEEESRELFDSVQAFLEEAGVPLRYGNANTWFLKADDWGGLQTSTMDAACGHNIDIWMPRGPGERDWRKLQNDIQMEWHAHPVNQARDARGAKPVNSAWLWGGGDAGGTMPISDYSHVWAGPDWTQALASGRNAASELPDADSVVAAAPEHGLLIIDTLSAPALAGDWSSWLEAWHAVEDDWLAPLNTALQKGKIAGINLVLSDSARLREIAVSRASLKKFWVQPTLARLVP